MLHNFIYKSYLDNKNINNYNKISYDKVLKSNKTIYNTDYFMSNQYLNNINLNKVIKLKNNIEKKEQIENEYDNLLKMVVKKCKICDNIKKKETNDIAIQCNLNSVDDFEIVECNDIPRSSFYSVGKYLSNIL